MAGVDDLHLGSDIEVVPALPATAEQLSLVHPIGYLDELASFCEAGGGALDPDTYATPRSFDLARQAVGAGLGAIAALKRHGDGIAFVAARPPGHHALAHRPMGFCLLNSIAVAAASLVAEGERVLIVDWDVHHGNGTQEIFWNEPSVLYVSTHQWPLYPGTGAASEVGGPRAPGLTVNVPVPPGSSGDTLRRGIETIGGPVIGDFAPTWILVSAGFDAHRDDPIDHAELTLSSGDYGELAKLVNGFAPRSGRLALFLEGGYDLAAVRGSVRAMLGQLLDVPFTAERPTGDEFGSEVIERILTQRSAALGRTAHDQTESGTA